VLVSKFSSSLEGTEVYVPYPRRLDKHKLVVHDRSLVVMPRVGAHDLPC
jgi:hypothetical protein